MNRETIEKAAIEYAEENLFYPEDIYNDSDIREMQDGLAYAYKAGAGWRINSVWHDRTASCEARRKALVLFKNGKIAARFNSCIEAARALGINYATVRKYLKGKIKPKERLEVVL